MKAKAVNEIQKFKRGQDPHQALGIGENNLDFIYNKVRTSLNEIGVSILNEWDDAEMHDFDLDWSNRPMISINTESKVWYITDNKDRTKQFATFDELIKYFIINHVGTPDKLDTYLINHQTELDKYTQKYQRLINNLNKMKEILNES